MDVGQLLTIALGGRSASMGLLASWQTAASPHTRHSRGKWWAGTVAAALALLGVEPQEGA